MIFTSPYPKVAIPQDQTLYSYVEKQAREMPGTAAFICGLSKRQITFAQLFTQTQQIVAGLHANGIKRGDVVILHSFNCIEYPVVFFALNRIGAICSPTSPLFTPQELADQINLAKAKAVISHKMLAPAAIAAAKIAKVPENQIYTLAQAPEIPKAYVVLKAGGEALTAQEVMDYVSSKVASFKKVRDVEFIAEVPKSLSGKILRRELQEKENEKIKAASAPQSRL
uniref:AMP-dependent synthetase/ligase domain-containing protein n=1 Tax=Globisporangium ultimum (strain ATCC 200006 / CBS 805.95 / DAOM BR144) TaxID=431595 RepID=K3WMF3_GLOUD